MYPVLLLLGLLLGLLLNLPLVSHGATRTIAWSYAEPTLMAQTFVVQRRIDTASWADIATVPARLGDNISYVDAALPDQSAPYEARYRVFAQQGTVRSPASEELSVGINGAPRLPQSTLKVAAVDSEETKGEQAPGTDAIDGQAASFWHTAWSTAPAPAHPHWITLDLGQRFAVDGLAYLPRQDDTNGRITEFEVAVSDTTTGWGTPVKTGSWPDGTMEQIVRFPAADGRYVRLLARAAVDGKPWTTVAEVSVFAQPALPPPPEGGGGEQTWSCSVQVPDPKTRIVTCVQP